MTGGKKWLIVVTDEQSDWLKEVSENVGLKGSDIVRELLDRTMQEDNKKFIASLANAQMKIKLQELNDKAVAIEEAKRQLKKQYSLEKVEA